MEPWGVIMAASLGFSPVGSLRTSTQAQGIWVWKGMWLLWCFFILQGGLRAEDSHTFINVFPAFQLELPYSSFLFRMSCQPLGPFSQAGCSDWGFD